jgi:hypothetical protein
MLLRELKPDIYVFTTFVSNKVTLFYLDTPFIFLVYVQG